MITRLTATYKVVCDRCGKTECFDDHEFENVYHEEVIFGDAYKTVKRGNVCKECYKAFREIAENFFDEVNKENEGKPKKKPKAEYIGFSSHDCESHYRCPECGKSFGSWSLIRMKETRCPHCNVEL